MSNDVKNLELESLTAQTRLTLEDAQAILANNKAEAVKDPQVVGRLIIEDEDIAMIAPDGELQKYKNLKNKDSKLKDKSYQLYVINGFGGFTTHNKELITALENKEIAKLEMMITIVSSNQQENTSYNQNKFHVEIVKYVTEELQIKMEAREDRKLARKARLTTATSSDTSAEERAALLQAMISGTVSTVANTENSTLVEEKA